MKKRLPHVDSCLHATAPRFNVNECKKGDCLKRQSPFSVYLLLYYDFPEDSQITGLSSFTFFTWEKSSSTF